ncbi:unnamed protein product [Calypogeia fissa]
MNDKVEAIQKWSALENITQLRSFLGLTGFYRRFVEHFSQIVHPLMTLLGKGVRWRWGASEDMAFQRLKKTLIHAPILKWYDPDRPIKIHVDASGIAVGGVLLQEWDNVWHPVAYFSRKLNQAE